MIVMKIANTVTNIQPTFYPKAMCKRNETNRKCGEWRMKMMLSRRMATA